MTDIINWSAVVIAITGTVANIYKKWWCFIVWGMANSLFAGIGLEQEDYPQVVIFTFYNMTCIYGAWKWRKDEDNLQISADQVSADQGSSRSSKNYSVRRYRR